MATTVFPPDPMIELERRAHAEPIKTPLVPAQSRQAFNPAVDLTVPGRPAAPKQRMSTDSTARKGVPLATGLLDYFPDALVAVAQLSKAGNDKHNPGQPLHWSRGKSSDHADCIQRHMLDRGTVDEEDGVRHSVKVAWRALAQLQEELEEALGLPPSRGSR
jgi:hypothetical protein